MGGQIDQYVLEPSVLIAIYLAFGAMLTYVVRRVALLRAWVMRGQTGSVPVRILIFSTIVGAIVFGIWGFVRLAMQMDAVNLSIVSVTTLFASCLSLFGIWLTQRLARAKEGTPLSDGLAKAPAKMVAERARLAAKRMGARASALDHERRMMMDQIQLASRIQSDIMRQSTTADHVDSSFWLKAMDQVSGDMLFTWQGGGQSGDAFNMFIGDASGHGLSAGLMSLVASTGLKGMNPHRDLREVMHRLNKLLLTDTTEMFVTGIVVRIDTDGLMSCKNCGHPPLIILPKDGMPILLTKSGLPLGMFDEEFEVEPAETYQLRPGDRIMVATDGLFEARDGQDDQIMYGVQRAAQLGKQNADKSVDQLIDVVKRSLFDYRSHEAGAPDDDVLVAVVEYLDEATQSRRKAGGNAGGRLNIFQEGRGVFSRSK